MLLKAAKLISCILTDTSEDANTKIPLLTLAKIHSRKNGGVWPRQLKRIQSFTSDADAADCISERRPGMSSRGIARYLLIFSSTLQYGTQFSFVMAKEDQPLVIDQGFPISGLESALPPGRSTSANMNAWRAVRETEERVQRYVLFESKVRHLISVARWCARNCRPGYPANQQGTPIPGG